ncbi:MAG: hypothetical protein ACPGU1_21885 [Myxococcota bacterium]
MRALCLAFSLTFIFSVGASLSSCATVDPEGLGENAEAEADAALQQANFGEGAEADSHAQTPPLGGGDDASEDGIGGGPQVDGAEGDEAQPDTEGEVPVDDAGASDDGPNPTPSTCVTAGAQCDDGDCCTQDDLCVVCEGGDCAAGELVCAGTPETCDDLQPCTDDVCFCDGGMPLCANEAVEDGTACDYSPNDCTTGDSCASGQCILSPPLDLDDENPCTEDTCDKGEVVHTFLLTGQCDDGDECTLDDHCELGLCVGGGMVECVAGECESSAYCMTGQGCVGVVLPVGAACDDDNVCTDDEACTAEQTCESDSVLDCDDGNACTSDSCDPETGACVNAPSDALDGSLCDADASCTGQGLCSEGVCVPMDGGDCEDGNPCTDNWCDPELGCQATLNSNPCNDGDIETCDDVCHDGQCVGSECEPVEPPPGGGDTCQDPIHLGDGGTLEVDLCDYNKDYAYGWCGMQGPELIFTLNVNYSQGQLQMSTEGSFEGILVNYRWQTLDQCESAASYSVNGFCYNGPAGIGWGGYNPDDVLYFAVGSFTGECGPVVITATTVPTG